MVPTGAVGQGLWHRTAVVSLAGQAMVLVGALGWQQSPGAPVTECIGPTHCSQQGHLQLGQAAQGILDVSRCASCTWYLLSVQLLQSCGHTGLGQAAWKPESDGEIWIMGEKNPNAKLEKCGGEERSCIWRAGL